MKPLLRILGVAVFCITATNAVAAEQTVTLNVENMYCASCPFIVKKTLARVEGVKNVDVSFRQRTATVTFDDKQCSVAKLTSTVTEAGFPATPVKR